MIFLLAMSGLNRFSKQSKRKFFSPSEPATPPRAPPVCPVCPEFLRPKEKYSPPRAHETGRRGEAEADAADAANFTKRKRLERAAVQEGAGSGLHRSEGFGSSQDCFVTGAGAVGMGTSDDRPRVDACGIDEEVTRLATKSATHDLEPRFRVRHRANNGCTIRQARPEGAAKRAAPGLSGRRSARRGRRSRPRK